MGNNLSKAPGGTSDGSSSSRPTSPQSPAPPPRSRPPHPHRRNTGSLPQQQLQALSQESTYSLPTVSTVSSSSSPVSESAVQSSKAVLSTQSSKFLPLLLQQQQQHHHHHHHHHHHLRTVSIDSYPTPRSRNNTMGNTQSGEASLHKSGRRRDRDFNPHSSPVQVPAGGRHQGRNKGPSTQFETPASGQEENYAPKSNLNFPPRLPLPIQEEVHTPGSPIISPEDLSSAIHDEDLDGALPHRTSLLSHTTADDDDETFDYEVEGGKGKTVPTVIEWRGKADKVYITGTFAAWSRKYRMQRNPNDSNALSTKLDLPPGTHHVKFIVDGEMELSNELPTAVDYTNILVNYIEVSADDIPQDKQEKPPDGLHPPLSLPLESSVQAIDFEKVSPETMEDEKRQHFLTPQDAHYAQIVPIYLQDLDRAEDSNRFRRGANHIAEIPPPPSLPLFLGKSILNGTTPMKDDSSVLNMPNHTVLNHLATSSIKNEVLATSVTTRYKRKYVTTITYKPSNPHD